MDRHAHVFIDRTNRPRLNGLCHVQSSTSLHHTWIFHSIKVISVEPSPCWQKSYVKHGPLTSMNSIWCCTVTIVQQTTELLFVVFNRNSYPNGCMFTMKEWVHFYLHMLSTSSRMFFLFRNFLQILVIVIFSFLLHLLY